jgi:hypothetical protein
VGEREEEREDCGDWRPHHGEKRCRYWILRVSFG